MKRALNGRIALITGGNHGIGAAIARALAADGASVFITYFRPTHHDAEQAIGPGYTGPRLQNGDAIVADCGAQGVSACSLEVDLAQPRHIPQLFDACESMLGPVDILVHNASSWLPDTFAPPGLNAERLWPPADSLSAVTAASIDLHLAVNARATALLMAEFGGRLIARGANWGRVVNLTTGGASGFPGEVSYGASKAALESYSRAAAQEYGPYGITVNVVCPGPTQTGWIEPQHEAALIRQTALRRLGQPEDVAAAVALLMDDRAGWITGQAIHASGGFRE